MDFGMILDGFWLSLALLGTPWLSLAFLGSPRLERFLGGFFEALPLRWSLSSKSVLAVACFCLLGRPFARSSLELI